MNLLHKTQWNYVSHQILTPAALFTADFRD